MLILTRKPGESIFIGDQVKVTIVEIKGNQIRVGIDAPPELRIYREEIYLQILEENKQAAQSGHQPAGHELEQLASAWNKPMASKFSKLSGSSLSSTTQPTLPSTKISKKKKLHKNEGDTNDPQASYNNEEDDK